MWLGVCSKKVGFLSNTRNCMLIHACYCVLYAGDYSFIPLISGHLYRKEGKMLGKLGCEHSSINNRFYLTMVYNT
jgi:hypothetical protein